MNLKDVIRICKDCPTLYPPVMVYRELLTYAQMIFGIKMDEARDKYGLYDGSQWIALLRGKMEGF